MAWNDDDFTGSDGSLPDPNKWAILTGSPDIQSNALELNTYSGETVKSWGILSGDFDIKIDFAVQGSPSSNSFRSGLVVFLDSTHYIKIGASRYSSANYFQVAYATGGSESYQAASRTNQSGELRLVRSGSNITPYYSDGEGGSSTGLTARAVGSGSGEIRIEAVNWTDYPSIDTRFDDFAVTSGTVSTTGLIKTTFLGGNIEYRGPSQQQISRVAGQVEYLDGASKLMISRIVGQVEISETSDDEGEILPVVFIVT